MVSMSLATTAGSLSLADLDAMPDDGRRYELLGGAIVMTAAPAPIDLDQPTRRPSPGGSEQLP